MVFFVFLTNVLCLFLPLFSFFSYIYLFFSNNGNTQYRTSKTLTGKQNIALDYCSLCCFNEYDKYDDDDGDEDDMSLIIILTESFLHVLIDSPIRLCYVY